MIEDFTIIEEDLIIEEAVIGEDLEEVTALEDKAISIEADSEAELLSGEGVLEVEEDLEEGIMIIIIEKEKYCLL
jgi:hypothetical protein